MSLTPKSSLKTVFSGLSSILLQKSVIQVSTSSGAQSITIDPDFDLPVKVDSLSISQGAPTINHYKVHGQETDWCSTSTPQDAEISLTIPSVHADLLQYFFGNAGTVTGSYGSGTWTGKSLVNEVVKVTCSLVLISDSGNDMFIVRQAPLWASLQYENGSTEPIAIQITGTIEGDGTNPDFFFLQKSAS